MDRIRAEEGLEWPVFIPDQAKMYDDFRPDLISNQTELFRVDWAAFQAVPGQNEQALRGFPRHAHVPVTMPFQRPGQSTRSLQKQHC